MFNPNNHSVDKQIQFDMYESYCEMADITMTQIKNNIYLIQINNNYANQDLQIESENCVVNLLNKEVIPETDVDGKELGIELIHYDYKITLRRENGYVKFTCPTFKGDDPFIKWIYRNESWAVNDIDNNIQVIKHN